MLISHWNRFVFIHVYKTGGTSIETALRRDGHSGYFYRLPPHATAVQVRARMAPLFDRYFTFGFVRNPWALEVSLYNFARRRGEIAATVGFEQFVADQWRHNDSGGRQAGFLMDDHDRPMVDFIGRLETIDRDFAQACSRIGLRGSRALPHRNRSTFGDWRTVHNARTVAMVADRAARDIRLFGYACTPGPPAAGHSLPATSGQAKRR